MAFVPGQAQAQLNNRCYLAANQAAGQHKLCWLDWTGWTNPFVNIGPSTWLLDDGSRLSATSWAGTPGVGFAAAAAPVGATVALGNTAYTGIPGQPVLRSLSTVVNANTLFFTTVSITRPDGSSPSTVRIIAGDASLTGVTILPPTVQSMQWTAIGVITKFEELPATDGSGTACIFLSTVIGTANCTGAPSVVTDTRLPATFASTDMPNGLFGNMNITTAGIALSGTPMSVAYAVQVASAAVRKTVNSRYQAGDQFQARMQAGGTDFTSVNTTGTTTGGASTVTTGPKSVAPNAPVVFYEVGLGGTNLANYVTTYQCVNARNGATSNGSGTTVTITPTYDDDWTCTFTNTAVARLTLSKTIVGRAATTDQFTLAINNGGPSVTSTGAATTVSTPVFTAVPGTAYQLSETGAGTPPANLAQYTTTYSCTNAGPGTTTVPAGSGTSIAVTPAPGDNLTCTFVNTPNLVNLSVTKTNTPGIGPVDQSGDQVLQGSQTSYDLVVSNAGPSTASNATLRDPAPTGLTGCVLGTPACAVSTGMASCPTAGAGAGQLSIANLQGAGVVIPSLTANSSVTIKISCTVQ
ncbi:DUF11 domain-containing protein [Luteimonas aquatica]|uniref:DUF11 domain-containing protein n=1 Tax=Luteimonas aquatica TaxID=450364 RepID=UPI001F57A7A8|nr:DUF11 domain-containing protein [Luteimonas aquatica]